MPDLIPDAALDEILDGDWLDLPVRHAPPSGVNPVEAVGPGASAYLRDMARELKACRGSLGRLLAAYRSILAGSTVAPALNDPALWDAARACLPAEGSDA